MDIQTRKKLPYEEADTATLRQALSHYASPDDKIGDMVSRGELLRLRRGLYAVSPAYRRSALSLEILANILYGPSYLSLEYALSWYGMIPERVTELTSVCLGRSRSFVTAVGNFSYCSVKRAVYADGFDVISLDDERSFLMAVREKALVDWVENRRQARIASMSDMAVRLLDDMRMDESTLMELNLERVEGFAVRYGSVKTGLLVKFLRKLRGER